MTDTRQLRTVELRPVAGLSVGLRQAAFESNRQRRLQWGRVQKIDRSDIPVTPALSTRLEQPQPDR